MTTRLVTAASVADAVSSSSPAWPRVADMDDSFLGQRAGGGNEGSVALTLPTDPVRVGPAAALASAVRRWARALMRSFEPRAASCIFGFSSS